MKAPSMSRGTPGFDGGDAPPSFGRRRSSFLSLYPYHDEARRLWTFVKLGGGILLLSRIFSSLSLIFPATILRHVRRAQTVRHFL